MDGLAAPFTAVHKFGGSSLKDAAKIKNITTCIKEKNAIIVVSAMQGITARLEQALHKAQASQQYATEIEAVFAQYANAANELAVSGSAWELFFSQESEKIKTVLQSIYTVGAYSLVERAFVVGFGELAMAHLLTAWLNTRAEVTAAAVDASRFLLMSRNHEKMHCDWSRSKLAWQLVLDAHHACDYLIVTGFIASDEHHNKILLDKNGSDVSAAITTALMGCPCCYIWTDRSGIYSADPNLVSTSFVLPSITYDEALELSYFGSYIIHPEMIAPAKKFGFNIAVKNSAHPDEQGTLISAKASPNKHLVRGLSSMKDIDLITVAGTGMMGVNGMAAKTFGACSDCGASVIFIAQASSEHSICFAVTRAMSDTVLLALQQAFKLELQEDDIQDIYIERDVAVVAAIGKDMSHKLGVMQRFSTSLARAGVNIRAISQGATEKNICAIVEASDQRRALRALHSGFYLAEKTLAVAVIGVGNVGAELLEQMRLAQAALLREEGVVIAVCGIMNSSKLLLADAPINLETWREQLSASQVPADVDQFIENFNANQYPNAVVIDCTANSMIAGRYADFIQNNLHVITPNKKAGSGDYDYYQFLKQVSKKHQRYFLYETTVCAALPVIHTLKDLLRTGDTVRNIRAVVSGSLSFIFNQVSRGCCFSDSVKQAHQCGYTEPDPREDLSGMDIARKMVCLAREMGHPATLDEIDGLNLVPKALQGVSKDEFLAQLHHYDEAMTVKINQLKQGFDKLACVGEISDSGTIKVKLNAVKNSDPLATLEQTDNMVVFTTERYRGQPLVIRGPGAGAAVTASGVFSDLLRLITYIRT